MGVRLSLCTWDQILCSMEMTIKGREKGYISITNTESVYHATSNPEHLAIINNADFSCCDGIGLVIAGRFLGSVIPRLHGPDLMLKCCDYGLERKWRHFFYGGKESVPELLSANLAGRFPGLTIGGAYSPPFRSLTLEEDQEIIKLITQAKPDILWVGLGLLKQEKWIADHLGKIDVPWMVGVGAAFDFHAGTIKRAPLAFQKIGLEWLYRLAFEPRMFVRNLRSFSILGSVAKEAIIKNFKRGRKND